MKLTNKQLKEAEGLIKETLPSVSTIIMAIGHHRIEYTEKELFEASIIFTNVLISKMFEHHVQGKNLSEQEMVALGDRMGTALHTLVKDGTGVDLKNIKFD